MSRHDAGARFITTPWVIPTICLVFIIVAFFKLASYPILYPSYSQEEELD